jgi:hypothetical protein
MLQTSGFGNIELFYTGLAFRGWVAYHNNRKTTKLMRMMMRLQLVPLSPPKQKRIDNTTTRTTPRKC